MLNRLIAFRGRAVALAIAIATWSVAPGLVQGASVPADRVTNHGAGAEVAGPAADLTERDVAASNYKVMIAFTDLARMWGSGFAQLGERFATPRLVRYRGVAGSSCGVMQPNNAAYCPRENTIYYDEVFVAAQVRSASLELGTDGDMAGIGVIAHEMGHAVAIQLGYYSPVVYDNESAADCLAGAFARHADDNGSLEPGDVDEAFFGMAAAADPTPRLTGNRRVDRRILTRAAIMGHGTQEQRMRNFRIGLDGGAGSCLDGLARIR